MPELGEVEDHLPTPVSDEAEWADAVKVAFSLWFHIPDRPDELARFPNLVVPSEQTLRSWQAVLDQSAEPVVRARLGDLLWQLPAKPRRHRQSRIASQAYEQLAGRWTGLDAKNAQIRALQLALELDDRARAASLIATAMSEFDTTIDDAAPGVSFGYLGILVYAPPGLRSTDLPSRFERAKTVYAAQPHLLKQLIEMQMHLAGSDPVQRAALDQELIHVFLRAAEQSAGLASYLHLQSAIQAAQNYPALRDIAMAHQREFDLTSLGRKPPRTRWKSILIVCADIELASWTDQTGRRRSRKCSNCLRPADTPMPTARKPVHRLIVMCFASQ
ncbi:MAG: hypothetical protein IPK97_05735 [Ahniella sp.]|nr:hypothetical protein [Ahniella sp.]